MHRLVGATALVLGTMVSSCLHRASGPGSESNYNLITRADIERVRAKTALDAVQRIRPDALASHAPKSVLLNPQTYPVVFLNTTYYGKIDELRNMAADDVEQIWIYGNTDGANKFGAQYGGGVIQIISRSGS